MNFEKGGKHSTGRYIRGITPFLKKCMVVNYATSPELSSQIPYPLVSKDSWVAFCVPSRYPEEANIEIGIKVKSPDGKIYTFDWAGTGKNVAKAARDSGQGEYSGIWLTSGSYITADGKNRESDVLYLTRIEDKFGNYLSFHYTNMATNDWDDNALLDKITASDGREVIIEYRDWNTIFPVLTDIKVNSPADNQTIHYEYQTVSNQKGHRHDLLTKVTTSEGLTWQYDYYLDNPLARDRRISAAYLPRKVTTPYGATIEYTYQSVNLPGIPGHRDCDLCDPEITFEGIAIQSQTLSGPGIDPAVWTYNFSAIEDYDATTVIDPYKNRTVYKHCGLRALDKISSCTAREGTIVSKQYLDSTGQLLQSEEYEWGLAKISDQIYLEENQSYIYDNVSKILLGQKTITRSEKSYTKEYWYNNVYGNVDAIIEYEGPKQPYSNPPTGGVRRDTAFQYETADTERWDVSLLSGVQVPDYVENEGTILAYGDKNTVTSSTTYGRKTTYSYYPNGDVNTVTDPQGNITQFENYRAGIAGVIKVTDVITGKTTEIKREINPDGTIASITDAEQKTTTYGYDDLKRVTSINTPRADDANIVIARSFSDRQQVFTRGGMQQIQLLDGLGRTIEEQVKAGDKTTITLKEYDLLGRIQSVSLPNSPLVNSYEYDVLDRVIKTTNPEQGIVVYDYSEPNKIKVTNERKFVTNYTLRAFGNPDDAEITRIESPENTITETFYSQLGYPLSITQNDIKRTYHYDDRYDLAYTFNPETGKTEIVNDALGNPLSLKIIRNEQMQTELTEYQRNGLEQLTLIDYPGETPDTQYDYYADGTLKSLIQGITRWDSH